MRVAVIGCGNMMGPIIKRIHQQCREIKFFTYTPSKNRARALALSVDGVCVDSLQELERIDVWFLGFKPQHLVQVYPELSAFTRDQKVISILAATPVKKITELLMPREVIRVMPNTPVELGEGITLIFNERLEDEGFHQLTTKWFESCGSVISCRDEEQFDLLTLFSGSGPGHLLHLAHLYAEKMESFSLDTSLAREVMSQLFIGVGHLIRAKDEPLSELRDQVVSKGGVTEAALKFFDGHDLAGMIHKAIDESKSKSDLLALGKI